MRIGTSIIITEGNTVFLLLNRRTDHWELPGGKIDEGESVVEAAVRELHEETDVKINSNELEFVGYYEHKQRPTYEDEHWLNMIFHVQEQYLNSRPVAVEDLHIYGKWFRLDRLPSNTWNAAANCILQLLHEKL